METSLHSKFGKYLVSLHQTQHQAATAVIQGNRSGAGREPKGAQDAAPPKHTSSSSANVHENVLHE